MPPQQTSLFSPTELAYLHSCLSQHPPIRPDARSPNTFRPLVAELDLLPTTHGSARLCFADGTEGIVGVKAEVEREVSKNAFPLKGIAQDAAVVEETGDHTWVEVAIESPGQREDEGTVTSLAQMTLESLTMDGILSQRLRINQNWHWKLYVDILLLSAPASYPLPLISLSTHLALLSTRLPALISQGGEDPLFNDDWEAATLLYPRPTAQGSQSIPLVRPPVSVMLISVGSNLFLDPSREELAVADAASMVTITTTPGTGVKVLGVRTLDLPAALTSSFSATLGGEPGFDQVVGGQGTWTPKRGGMTRQALTNMIKICSRKGGIGEDVLSGLASFL